MTAVASTSPPTYAQGVQPDSMTLAGGKRVQLMDGSGHDVSPTHPLPVSLDAPGTVTPVAPSGALTLAAGGVSQALTSAASFSNGLIIENPLTATQQGIAAAESIFVNITGGAAVLTSGATSLELFPGDVMTITTGFTTAINWNATTIGHKISAVVM